LKIRVSLVRFRLRPPSSPQKTLSVAIHICACANCFPAFREFCACRRFFCGREVPGSSILICSQFSRIRDKPCRFSTRRRLLNPRSYACATEYSFKTGVVGNHGGRLRLDRSTRKAEHFAPSTPLARQLRRTPA